MLSLELTSVFETTFVMLSDSSTIGEELYRSMTSVSANNLFVSDENLMNFFENFDKY